MEEQMRLLLNMFKEQVKHNLQIIKRNEEEIRSILTQPISNSRSERLSASFDKNRALLDENRDSMAIELQLINYLTKYRETLRQSINEAKLVKYINNLNSTQNKDTTNEEQVGTQGELAILNQTIIGKLPFNPSHPRFNDEDFFESLMDSYMQSENYEMCSQILKTKGSSF